MGPPSELEMNDVCGTDKRQSSKSDDKDEMAGCSPIFSLWPTWSSSASNQLGDGHIWRAHAPAATWSSSTSKSPAPASSTRRRRASSWAATMGIYGELNLCSAPPPSGALNTSSCRRRTTTARCNQPSPAAPHNINFYGSDYVYG